MLAIAIGNQQHCPINYTAGIVASLAVPELFIPESQLGLGAFATGDDGYSDQEQAEHPASEKQKAYNKAHYSFSAQDRHSDVLKLLSAFCAYMWASNSEDDLELFCARMFLKSKAMKETLQLYKQLVNIIALNHPGTIDTSKTPLSPPSKPQIAALKQIVAAGFLGENWLSQARKTHIDHSLNRQRRNSCRSRSSAARYGSQEPQTSHRYPLPTFITNPRGKG